MKKKFSRNKLYLVFLCRVVSSLYLYFQQLIISFIYFLGTRRELFFENFDDDEDNVENVSICSISMSDDSKMFILFYLRNIPSFNISPLEYIEVVNIIMADLYEYSQILNKCNFIFM